MRNILLQFLGVGNGLKSRIPQAIINLFESIVA